ncbi:MAG: DNA recombination protein RmuC [Tidjanibacter sp.]|nr:DNA recombination protein RmuC [Tidjanibacter sp.]
MTVALIILIVLFVCTLTIVLMQRSSAEKNRRRLEEEREMLRQQLQQSQGQVNQLHVELVGQKTTTDHLRENLERVEGEKNNLKEKAEELQRGVGERDEQLKALDIELVKSRSECNKMRERMEESKQELEKLQASFRVEFQNLANEILDEKSKQFKQTNKESMEVFLKPFQEDISKFRERVEHIYAAENEQHGALKAEIKGLMELNQRITQETSNLTKALKGDSKVQGDFGEMILETILEQSNLQRGVHYTVQENIKNSEGQNMRPDVVLNLPEGKRIIIDSKVSLTAYVDYVGAEDKVTRDAAFERHVSSVRAHIKELAGKRYQDLIDTAPDFVIMFIPNEPAFMSAMQNRPELWSEAYQKKIIISSPTNLFALLKIVDDLWKRDMQSRHALEIAEAGGRLYDKFVGFVENMNDIEKNLKKATESYDKAYKQLTGKGSLVTRAQRMRELGVKANKTLPSGVLDAALEDGDGESE